MQAHAICQTQAGRQCGWWQHQKRQPIYAPSLCQLTVTGGGGMGKDLLERDLVQNSGQRRYEQTLSAQKQRDAVACPSEMQ